MTSGMKVTSSEALRSHPADAAVDGDVRTCYYSNRNPPKWWKLDMSRTLDILAVSIILPTSGKWNGIFLPPSPFFSAPFLLAPVLYRTFFKFTRQFFSLTHWTCVGLYVCVFHFISFHSMDTCFPVFVSPVVSSPFCPRFSLFLFVSPCVAGFKVLYLCSSSRAKVSFSSPDSG